MFQRITFFVCLLWGLVAGMDTAHAAYSTQLEPGQYLEVGKGLSMKYWSYIECKENYYCPGGHVDVPEPNMNYGLEPCPDGTTSPAGSTSIGACVCNAGTAFNSSGACETLCGGGVTTLHTSTGTSVPLFAVKNTTPSIYIETSSGVCYADLVPGNVTGTINVRYNDKIYHTVQ